MSKYNEALTKTTETKRPFEFKDFLELAGMGDIKCKNCNLWRSENNKHGQCPKMLSHSQVITQYDFFCSNFIRK